MGQQYVFDAAKNTYVQKPPGEVPEGIYQDTSPIQKLMGITSQVAHAPVPKQEGVDDLGRQVPPTPQDQAVAGKVAGGLMRYGAPAVAAGMTGGMSLPATAAIMGGVGAGSSLAADQLEQGPHVPTGKELLGAGVEGAVNAVIPPLLTVTGNAVKTGGVKVLQKVLVPPEFLQNGLDALNPGDKALAVLLQQMGTSPLPRQVFDTDFFNGVDSLIQNSLPGIPGKGLLKSAYQKQQQDLTDAALNYVKTNASMGYDPNALTGGSNGVLADVSKERLGQLYTGILQGKINMRSVANGINYRTAGQAADNIGLQVDLGGVMKYVTDEAANNPALGPVLNKVKSLLPSGAVDPQVTKVLDSVQQTFGKPFSDLKPIMQQQIQAQYPGMDLTGAGNTLVPASSAMNIIHEMNSFYGTDLSQAAAKIGQRVSDTLDEAYAKGASDLIKVTPNPNPELLGMTATSTPEQLRYSLGIDSTIKQNFNDAYASWKLAQTTAGRFSNVMDQKLVQGTVQQLRDAPAAAVQTVLGAEGNQSFDRLMAIKKAFGMTETGGSTGATSDYTQNVVEPIRYQIFRNAQNPQTGQISGNELYKQIDGIGLDMGKELFGSEMQYNQMKDFSLALQRAGQSSEGKLPGIWIIRGLQTGGIIRAATEGSDIWNDNPTANMVSRGVQVAGTLAIASPALFSKYIAANPKFTQMMLEGFTAGPGTSAWTRMAGMATSLEAKQEMVDSQLTPGQKQYYYDPNAQEYVKEGQNPEPQLQIIPSDQIQRELGRLNEMANTPEGQQAMQLMMQQHQQQVQQQQQQVQGQQGQAHQQGQNQPQPQQGGQQRQGQPQIPQPQQPQQ